MKNLYIFLNKYNALFWTRIVVSTRPKILSLSFFRIIVGIFLLSNYISFRFLETIPQAFFNPPLISIASFFDDFPRGYTFYAIDIILFISIICITLGIRAKWFSLTYSFVIIFAQSFLFSFGKIDHGNILLIVTMLCLAFSGWGSKMAIVPDKEPDFKNTEKCFSLLAVFICFGFFTAGFGKAIHWINFDPNINGVGSWYYRGYYTNGRQYLLAPYFAHVPMIGLKMMDFAAVFFELSPIFFLLFSPKSWRLFLVVTISFHLVNLLIFNINFGANAIAYMAFVDYTSVQKWFRQKDRSTTFSLPIGLILVFLLLTTIQAFVIVINYLTGSKLSVVNYLDNHLGMFAFQLMFWVVTFAIMLSDYFSRPSKLANT